MGWTTLILRKKTSDKDLTRPAAMLAFPADVPMNLLLLIRKCSSSCSGDPFQAPVDAKAPLGPRYYSRWLVSPLPMKLLMLLLVAAKYGFAAHRCLLPRMLPYHGLAAAACCFRSPWNCGWGEVAASPLSFPGAVLPLKKDFVEVCAPCDAFAAGLVSFLSYCRAHNLGLLHQSKHFRSRLNRLNLP